MILPGEPQQRQADTQEQIGTGQAHVEGVCDEPQEIKVKQKGESPPEEKGQVIWERSQGDEEQGQEWWVTILDGGSHSIGESQGPQTAPGGLGHVRFAKR